MGHSELYLYSGNHSIPIFQRNGYFEERNLSINIIDFGDKVQIKLRDLTEYSFNYTEYIDLGDFEVIRVNQSLDINYAEFKTNLVEMLHQFQKKEMFLKCQLSDKNCTLVFYTKSKIKSIVYLTLELHLTDQKEIISEMYIEINDLQDTNKKLQKHVSTIKKIVEKKEIEIHDLEITKNLVMNQFFKNLCQIETLFISKLTHIQNQVTYKISSFKNQILKLQRKIEILKQENNLKVDSSERLLKTMESLRLETVENAQTIQNLKKENTSLSILRLNLEKSIADLKRTIDDVQSTNKNLEKSKIELEKDLEKLSVAMIQKESKLDELSKDLVQANNMLVGFNNHYDNKARQVEELQEAILVKDKLIADQKCRTNEVLKSFEEYRTTFNTEKFESKKRDLLMSNRRIGELEEEIRKLNKINALLSQKVSEGYFNMK